MMNFPVTITMRREKKRTRKATAVDSVALKTLAPWIMDNWNAGFSFLLEQNKTKGHAKSASA